MIALHHEWQYVNWIWIAWLALWLLTALRVKRTRRVEALGQRLTYLIPLVAAFLLLFANRWRLGALDHRFLSADLWVGALGLLLTLAGTGLALWARLLLGGNWSARISIKQGHQLVRSGPYARLRHPIYSGLVLAMLGTALVLGEWRGLLALAVAMISYRVKAAREETFLAQEFGASFAQYRARSGMLLPRWR